MSKRRTLGVFGAGMLVMLVVATGVQIAVAVSSPADTIAGKGVTVTKIVRSNDGDATGGIGWIEADGIDATVNVPDGPAIILVSLTAESSCTPSKAVEPWCSVRARIGNGIGEPNEGTDFAWQSATADDPYLALGMTRSRQVGSGSYRVSIEMNGNGNSLRLDDVSMVVQVIKIP